MQVTEGEALHAESMQQGTEMDVPYVDSILALESISWDRAPIL